MNCRRYPYRRLLLLERLERRADRDRRRCQSFLPVWDSFVASGRSENVFLIDRNIANASKSWITSYRFIREEMTLDTIIVSCCLFGIYFEVSVSEFH